MAKYQIEPLRTREIVAFFVSALIVPGFWLSPFIDEVPNLNGFAEVFVFVVIFGIGGFFALGLPIYILLIERNWTAFWIAPIVGAFIGMFVWLAFQFLIGIFLGLGISLAVESILEPDQLRSFLWPAAGQGVIVGIVLWLIARPDRINRKRDPDSEPNAPAEG